MNGKLFVIEGTDGSGKATQTKRLVDRLTQEGVQIVTFSFPQYGTKSAGLIEEYLNGKYGKANEVDSYIASLFYSLDRYDASFKIREALESGKVVILDRYVDSNVGHQGGKFTNETKREKFMTWLYELEYKTLNIPKPDLVLILHVAAEAGKKFVAKKQSRDYIKNGTYDAHEADSTHLKNAENCYLWLAEKYPDNHILIECMKNNEVLSIENVHEKVYKTIAPLIS